MSAKDSGTFQRHNKSRRSSLLIIENIENSCLLINRKQSEHCGDLGPWKEFTGSRIFVQAIKGQGLTSWFSVENLDFSWFSAENLDSSWSSLVDHPPSSNSIHLPQLIFNALPGSLWLVGCLGEKTWNLMEALGKNVLSVAWGKKNILKSHGSTLVS